MQTIDQSVYDFQKFSSNLTSAYLKYQEVMGIFMSICANQEAGAPGSMIQELSQVMLPVMQFWSNPAIIMPMIQQFASSCALNNLSQAKGTDSNSRKFADLEWTNNPFFALMKDTYIKQSDWLNNIAKCSNISDEKQKKKLEFYTKRFSDSISPANFAFSNPEVIREAILSNGENFVKGMENLLQDLRAAQKNGKFSIPTVDKTAFAVGENLAITPGKVVYQNELMQLIQYEAVTKEVHKTPLLLIPAWINKFYILDLQPANSYVKWLTEQGYTVFMISWVNPDKSFAHKTFEDYLMDGAVTVIKKVAEITKEQKIHCAGYCLGGTLLAIALAYLSAKKIDIVQSVTFLTTLVDFAECGDVGVFIDELELRFIESIMAKDGILDGYYLYQTFSMLRADDMIWSFFVNNYLLGKSPRAFDILYWNSDSTSLPAAMHSFYLRKMYQDNALVVPNALKFCDISIDLRNIKIPAYILSTKDDHIAPWKSAYKAVSIYSGNNRFVLSGSGHVAGAINHPSKEKYCYWTNEKLEKDPEAWKEQAKEFKGSWWNDWLVWMQKHGAAKIPQRSIDKKMVVEDAPGSYVKKKLSF